MADLPRYEKWALLLTAGFVLFTGGWFLAGHSSPEPYTITAAPEDLERLPGIGPAKAEAIAAYRFQNKRSFKLWQKYWSWTTSASW